MRTVTVPLTGLALFALFAGACASAPAPTPAAVSASAASPPPAPVPPSQEPELVSGGTREGRGYPAGSSASGTAMALTRTAESERYGYSPEEPVLVGGGEDLEAGPRRERLYLSALRGPEGQPIEFERRGSCCPFPTENSPLGGGLLDVYDLWYEGLDESIVLYINMYDPGEPLIPQGLTARE